MLVCLHQDRFILPSSTVTQLVNSDQSQSWAFPAGLWWYLLVIFEASAFPNSGQRHLSAPADFPSINGAAYVCANCQFAARLFVWLRRAGLASRRAHFPLHSVWRPSSEDGKRKEKEGREEEIRGREETLDSEGIGTETEKKNIGWKRMSEL